MKLNLTDENIFERLQFIEYVLDAFNQLEINILDNVFVTLQICMESIILAGGGNSYKMNYINKTKLCCDGRLTENYIFRRSLGQG